MSTVYAILHIIMLKHIEYYSDYRKYIKDFYTDQKSRYSYFSNRFFCKKANISSPSLLKEVIDGKRNLTEKTIPKFIKGLGLTENSGKYFRALVLFNQSKGHTEKQQYLDLMHKLSREVKQHVIPVDHYAYYSNWYNPVIRELCCIIDWDNNYRILANSIEPSITVQQARESIALLIKIGFIEKTEDGYYIQKSPAITTGQEITSEGVRSLNKKLSMLGTAAIEDFTPDERDITSLTIGINYKNFPLIKEEIQEFKKRIIRIVDGDKDPDMVYNINMQLFPLSKKKKL